MEHYRQRLLCQASQPVVFAALTTLAGLRAWWTEDCEGDAGPGGSLLLRFGPHYKRLQVEQLDAPSLLRWHCSEAHIALDSLPRKDEWVGTQIVLRLQALPDGRTQLDFEHVGLVPTFGCYSVCREGWQHFLASLQGFVDHGRGQPFVADAVLAGQ